MSSVPVSMTSLCAAEELRSGMRKAGVTQEVLAEAIGRSVQHVSRCMNGHRSFTIDELDVAIGLVSDLDLPAWITRADEAHAPDLELVLEERLKATGS